MLLPPLSSRSPTPTNVRRRASLDFIIGIGNVVLLDHFRSLLDVVLIKWSACLRRARTSITELANGCGELYHFDRPASPGQNLPVVPCHKLPSGKLRHRTENMDAFHAYGNLNITRRPRSQQWQVMGKTLTGVTNPMQSLFMHCTAIDVQLTSDVPARVGRKHLPTHWILQSNIAPARWTTNPGPCNLDQHPRLHFSIRGRRHSTHSQHFRSPSTSVRGVSSQTFVYITPKENNVPRLSCVAAEARNDWTRIL